MSTPPLAPLVEAYDPDLRRSDVSVFVGRLPDPAELVQWGGLPGVKYLMVDSRNLHEALKLPPEVIGGQPYKWGPTRGVGVYEVQGPAGSTTLMVLSAGKPIPGADPANGIRSWRYDRTLLSATGLKTPYGDGNAEQVVQASKNDAGSSPQPPAGK